MKNKDLPALLPQYINLEEKSKCFRRSVKYVKNCINSFEEFDEWFTYWTKVNKQKKYKVYFRGMEEARHKLFNSAQRLWINYAMENWKKKKPSQAGYKDFVIKMITDALGEKTLLRNVFEIYGINGPREDFPCLSILQHYGAPTPLLDWTYNLQVALFFATEPITGLPQKIDSELDNYFSIYVISEQTSEISEIVARERALDCFPNHKKAPSPHDLLRLTDIQLNKGVFNPTDPFKKLLMATIYNQNIIPQEGLFIFNPHALLPIEDLYKQSVKGKEAFQEVKIPASLFIGYNIHKRLAEYIKRKIAMAGITKDYIMPDLKDYSKKIREKVLNDWCK